MARTGRATVAAAELNVTHGAVSRQVRALEETLGFALFEGPKHQQRLTPRGRDLADGLGPAFDALEAAVRSVGDRRELRLAVHPSLAVKWLIPRLADFERHYPDTHLVIADLPVGAMRLRGTDLSLRFASQAQLGQAGVEVLALTRVGPVCSPQVADTFEGAPRLAARTHPSGWADWAEAKGEPAPAEAPRLLAHVHFLVDAALSGLGVAILPRLLVADDLAAGRLVAPFGFVPDGGALVVVRPTAASTRPEREIIAWLKAQANA